MDPLPLPLLFVPLLEPFDFLLHRDHFKLAPNDDLLEFLQVREFLLQVRS